MKEWLDRDQETPIHASHWSAGIGRPAGLFWYEGRCVIAGYGTRAEHWLLVRGAIAIGTLRFDRERVEARAAGPVRTVPPDSLADAPPPRN